MTQTGQGAKNNLKLFLLKQLYLHANLSCLINLTIDNFWFQQVLRTFSYTDLSGNSLWMSGKK